MIGGFIIYLFNIRHNVQPIDDYDDGHAMQKELKMKVGVIVKRVKDRVQLTLTWTKTHGSHDH
jgi:hypothetical protein